MDFFVFVFCFFRFFKLHIFYFCSLVANYNFCCLKRNETNRWWFSNDRRIVWWWWWWSSSSMMIMMIKQKVGNMLSQKNENEFCLFGWLVKNKLIIVFLPFFGPLFSGLYKTKTKKSSLFDGWVFLSNEKKLNEQKKSQHI